MPAWFITHKGLACRLCAVMLAVLIVVSPGTLAFTEEQGSRLDELMHLLAQRQHGHAAFVERQYLAILERPLESSGELFYDAPDRIEKRTLRPKPESLVLEKGVVTVRRGARTYALSLRDYPQFAPLIESVLATLAGDRAALERAYTLSLDSADAAWTLGLAPREVAVSAVVARIRITGVGEFVREVEVQRTDGDRSVMTVSELPGK